MVSGKDAYSYGDQSGLHSELRVPPGYDPTAALLHEPEPSHDPYSESSSPGKVSEAYKNTVRSRPLAKRWLTEFFCRTRQGTDPLGCFKQTSQFISQQQYLDPKYHGTGPLAHQGK